MAPSLAASLLTDTRRSTVDSGTREDIDAGHKATRFAALNDLPKLEVLVKRSASATFTSTSRYLETCLDEVTRDGVFPFHAFLELPSAEYTKAVNSFFTGACKALLEAGDFEMDSETSKGA